MLKLAYLAPAILEKLLITVANPGRTISALMLGWLDGPGGYHAMFGAIWALSVLGAGFTMFAL